MSWKIYYEDQSTFSNGDGPWADAPPWGVMAVAILNDWVGYSLGTDDFYIKDTEPRACNVWGLMDYLLEKGVLASDQRLSDLTADVLTAAGVKFGRSVANDEWQEIKHWIGNDPDMPHKSGRYVDERP